MTADKPGKKVAIVVVDGFEQVELTTPRKALQEAGFTADIVSPAPSGTVQGYHHADKGDSFPVDVPLGKAKPEDYDALLLPGGVSNPDALRHNPKVLEFVRHFLTEGKPIAAICHGPWTLIDAGGVSGRKLTSWPSLKTDLINAGAQWVDETVVVDQGLVTSRNPQDLPAFCKKIIEEFKEGPHRSTPELALLAKLGELIKDIGVAMLTTQEADGSLHSRPMATQLKKLDRSLWFFTALDSGKSQEIAKESAVNVSYADPKSNRYVSVSGRAKVVRDRKKAEELWTPLVKAWFPKGLDDPELALLQVTIDQAEFWDAPAGKTVALFGLAKSLLTGRPYQGEGTIHEKLDLDAARSSVTSEASAESAKPAIAAEEPASAKSDKKSALKSDDKSDSNSEETAARKPAEKSAEKPAQKSEPQLEAAAKDAPTPTQPSATAAKEPVATSSPAVPPAKPPAAAHKASAKKHRR